VLVAQKNSGDPPQISYPPWTPPPPRPPQNRLVYIPIDSSWRQDSKYVICISIDKRRQKVMILEPSWLLRKINEYGVKGVSGVDLCRFPARKVAWV